MANNQLQWNNIQPNFIGSNQATAVGSQMLSSAGDIFSKTAEYTQKEAVRLSQERDKLFESAGKELSNLALQEGMEATVLSDGSVRHTFNSEKYDQAISRYATEKGYDGLDEDARAKIWASLNVNTDYQLGLANNQANAQNAIDRARLGLEGRKLDQQNKIFLENLFDNTKQYFINHVLNPNSSPEDKEKFIQTLRSSATQLTDPTQKAYVNKMIYFAENPQEVSKYTKDPTNLFGIIGANAEDLARNVQYQSYYKTETENNNKTKFIESLNDGTFGVSTINNIKKENKIGSLNDDEQEKALGQIMNIYALSLIDKGKSPEEIKNITKAWLDNKLQTTKDENGNITGKININTQDILSDLVQGKNSTEVKSVIGQVSEEQFNKLSKLAQELTKTSMDTKPKSINKVVDKPKPTSKNLAVESANNLSEKHNITFKNTNNIDISLYRNSKSGLDQMFKNLKDVGSVNYNTITRTILTSNNSIYNSITNNNGVHKSINFNNISPEFRNFLQLEFEKGNTDVNTAYALKILIKDPSFSKYQTNVVKYIKSDFEDTNLKNEINLYQQEFKQSLEQLKNQINEAQSNYFNKKAKQEYNKQQNKKEFNGWD